MSDENVDISTNEEINEVVMPEEKNEDEKDKVKLEPEVKAEKLSMKRAVQPKMDPNFYYDYESMVFKPVISEESKLSNNFLQL